MTENKIITGSVEQPAENIESFIRQHAPSLPCAKPSTVLEQPLPKDGFKAEIIVESSVAPPTVSSRFTLEVKVKNVSSCVWPARGSLNGDCEIHLSYHWLNMDGNTFQYDGLRTALPHDIAPGEDVTLQAAVKAPYMSGEYLLEFDMVQERVCWFAQRGSATSSITMRVEQIIV